MLNQHDIDRADVSGVSCLNSSAGRGAMESPTRQLGPLETRLLALLCRRKDATVRELLEDTGIHAAYTTVMTTLDRLYKKRFLDRAPDNHSRAFRYRLRKSEREFYEAAVGGDIGRLLSQAVDPSAPLSFLVDAVAAYDTALLDELSRALARKRRELRNKEKP
jgi:predicted transcriptional regulator